MPLGRDLCQAERSSRCRWCVAPKVSCPQSILRKNPIMGEIQTQIQMRARGGSEFALGGEANMCIAKKARIVFFINLQKLKKVHLLCVAQVCG